MLNYDVHMSTPNSFAYESPNIHEKADEDSSRDMDDPMTYADADELSRLAEERVERAEQIVLKYVLWSVGAGAIPVPLFDIASSVVLQLKLIEELAEVYGFDHREDLARNAIGTLLSTIAGLMLGARIGASLAKFLPGAGTKYGIIRTAVFFGISTHISGKILIMHFEAGGSLLTLDPIAMRHHFNQEFANSQRYVSNISQPA